LKLVFCQCRNVGQFYEIFDTPLTRDDTCRHGRSRFQGLADADKVVVAERDRDAVGQHVGFFAKSINYAGVNLELSDIHFHDSQLLRVVEDAKLHELQLEVMYPVNWDNNLFEPRIIAFLDVLNYRVEEGPFCGAPTLLDAYDNGQEGNYRSVTLQTNAGTRSLLFKHVELRLMSRSS
jgi:hypothetical protein